MQHPARAGQPCPERAAAALSAILEFLLCFRAGPQGCWARGLADRACGLLTCSILATAVLTVRAGTELGLWAYGQRVRRQPGLGRPPQGLATPASVPVKAPGNMRGAQTHPGAGWATRAVGACGMASRGPARACAPRCPAAGRWLCCAHGARDFCIAEERCVRKGFTGAVERRTAGCRADRPCLQRPRLWLGRETVTSGREGAHTPAGPGTVRAAHEPQAYLYRCSFSSAHSVRSSLSHTPLNVPCWARLLLSRLLLALGFGGLALGLAALLHLLLPGKGAGNTLVGLALGARLAAGWRSRHMGHVLAQNMEQVPSVAWMRGAWRRLLTSY
jgi:hypothetical protein